eukprot:m.363473 g.363473  ORF g.363473 m.363473 type:complete len:127 (-) comp22743_c0_seq1:58-438(-)
MADSRRPLLDDVSDSEEDVVPQPPQDAALRRAQQEVDGVKQVMRNNIGKVLERGAKLDQLEEDAEALRDGAAAFHRQSRKLRRQMCWQNARTNVIVGCLALALLIIAIVVGVHKHHKNNPSTPAPP